MADYRFPKECKAVIDVTKAPYFADHTGQRDCTKILCQIIDEIVGEYAKNLYETEEKLENMEDPDALITFEIRKVNGRKNVIFPENFPESRIIYFPDGTYLVSDTISYSIEELRNYLRGLRNLEMNARIRFMGQSRDGVRIKLKDHCKGFEYGNDRPVISFAQGVTSNIAMTNMIENMTIDVGVGNPGATGIRYFANNTGAIRNIRIVSSDPEFKGNTGLSILHDRISAGYVKHLEIEGFCYGVKIDCQGHFAVLEHVKLRDQKRAGFYIGNNSVVIRDLQSNNFVPAVCVEGRTARTMLLDAVLTGGNPIDTAIYARNGQSMFRNVISKGYEHTAFTYTDTLDGCVEEYCTFGPKTLFEMEHPKSLQLPVEETPETEWEAPEKWVCVNDHGAAGDGVTDDTKAIQKAFDSGHGTIYFQPGTYYLNDVIKIPASVKRINFMYGDLVSGPELAGRKDTGVFLIEEASEEPLVIEDLYAMEKFYGFVTLLEHACTRTLILSDLHVQAASMYFNTVPGGKVYMENVGCTIGGVPGSGVRTEKLLGEEKYPYSREVPCYRFSGQKVWCRQINPERSLHEIINDGGQLWVLGGKTEEEGTAFETIHQGETEAYGMVFCVGLNKNYPIIVNDHSNVSVYGSTNGSGARQVWPVAVKEIQNQEIRCFYNTDMPAHEINNFVIPLYIGKNMAEQ